MKCMVVFVAVLAVSSAQFGSFGRSPLTAFAPKPSAPVARAAGSDQTAPILRSESDIKPDGSYSYSYETGNGIAAQEQGTPRQIGNETPDVAQGTFAYTSPEGVPVSISYVADENGYQPSGDSLPVPPPVPPQIAKALEYIIKNAPKQ